MAHSLAPHWGFSGLRLELPVLVFSYLFKTFLKPVQPVRPVPPAPNLSGTKYLIYFRKTQVGQIGHIFYQLKNMFFFSADRNTIPDLSHLSFLVRFFQIVSTGQVRTGWTGSTLIPIVSTRVIPWPTIELLFPGQPRFDQRGNCQPRASDTLQWMQFACFRRKRPRAMLVM